MNSNKFLASYLKDRPRIVKVDGVSSEPSTLYIGVPQGSVLGPMLFLLSDLSLGKTIARYTLFADNTTFSVTGKYIHEVESSTIEAEIRAQNWFNANRLLLNVDKHCQYGLL